MNIQKLIIDGIKVGVNRHWNYTKDLLHVKPEYLLTVPVADELTKGFDDINGIDFMIRLEEPTHYVCGKLMYNSVGHTKYFMTPRHRVQRKGKVDIYVEHEKDCWVIELKGFDPSAPENKKDLIRLIEILSANERKNNCKGCFLAFPTLDNKKEWIKEITSKVDNVSKFNISGNYQFVETNEDEEDGMPYYYVYCISLLNKDT